MGERGKFVSLAKKNSSVLEKISCSTRTSTVTYFLQDRGEFFSASVCKKFETILCRLKIVESCEKQPNGKMVGFKTSKLFFFLSFEAFKGILKIG